MEQGLQQAILDVLAAAPGDVSEHDMHDRLVMRGFMIGTADLHASLNDLRDEGKVQIEWRPLTYGGFGLFAREAVNV